MPVDISLNVADCIEFLPTIADSSIDCCVTSPPYWGLRDYCNASQLGNENTPEEYILKMVKVFREVRRVLKNNGTLWLNIGDTYTKQKQLTGIPWRLAFALQNDGWILRQDIIWHKPNAMPESVKDRCTKSHEYVFLMSKSKDYYFDYQSIKQEAVSEKPASNVRGKYIDAYNNGKEEHRTKSGLLALKGIKWEKRNRRSVWSISTQPFPGSHFAVMPENLVEPCVLAGCIKGGTVLDPFAGSGTVGVIAKKQGKNFIGIELNPDFANIAKERIANT